MSTPAHDDDAERDAWLSEALRHAPDAQAAPPPALSDAILRQAHAATLAVAPTVARPQPAWAVVWDWLARPPVAAGFASVMVATLVGMIWWDRPIDPVPVRESAAPEAVPAASPPTAARTPPPAPASPTARRESPETSASRDSRAAADAAPTRRARGAEPAAATAAAAPVPQAIAPPPQTSLAVLLASIGAQPERWQWQRGGAMQPMNAALQRWLARLDAATATRWRSDADAASGGEATVLRLYRDGALAATLRLDDASAALGPALRANLAPDETRLLKRALDDAAP